LWKSGATVSLSHLGVKGLSHLGVKAYLTPAYYFNYVFFHPRGIFIFSLKKVIAYAQAWAYFGLRDINPKSFFNQLN